MNPFDAIKGTVFNTISGVFGNPATWNGYTATVPFVELSEDEKLGGAVYSPNKQKIQYMSGMFPGLKDAVDGGSKSELLTIKGRAFLVRKVDTVIDGDCFIAELYAK